MYSKNYMYFLLEKLIVMKIKFINLKSKLIFKLKLNFVNFF